LKALFYKAFLSTTGDGFVIKKEKERNRKTDFLVSKRDKYIYRIRGLSVFIGKNSKALKRRKYKGFCVFLLYGMVVVVLK